MLCCSKYECPVAFSKHAASLLLHMRVQASVTSQQPQCAKASSPSSSWQLWLPASTNCRHCTSTTTSRGSSSAGAPQRPRQHGNGSWSSGSRRRSCSSCSSCSGERRRQSECWHCSSRRGWPTSRPRRRQSCGCGAAVVAGHGRAAASVATSGRSRRTGQLVARWMQTSCLGSQSTQMSWRHLTRRQ